MLGLGYWNPLTESSPLILTHGIYHGTDTVLGAGDAVVNNWIKTSVYRDFIPIGIKDGERNAQTRNYAYLRHHLRSANI